MRSKLEWTHEIMRETLFHLSIEFVGLLDFTYMQTVASPSLPFRFVSSRFVPLLFFLLLLPFFSFYSFSDSIISLIGKKNDKFVHKACSICWVLMWYEQKIEYAQMHFHTFQDGIGSLVRTLRLHQWKWEWHSFYHILASGLEPHIQTFATVTVVVVVYRLRYLLHFYFMFCIQHLYLILVHTN